MGSSQSDPVEKAWAEVHDALVSAWRELECDSWTSFNSLAMFPLLRTKYLPALKDLDITQAWSSKIQSIRRPHWEMHDHNARCAYASNMKDVAELLFKHPKCPHKDAAEYRQTTLHEAWVQRRNWDTLWPPSEEEKRTVPEVKEATLLEKKRGFHIMFSRSTQGLWWDIAADLHNDLWTPFVEYNLRCDDDLLEMRRDIIIASTELDGKPVTDAFKNMIRELLLKVARVIITMQEADPETPTDKREHYEKMADELEKKLKS